MNFNSGLQAALSRRLPAGKLVAEGPGYDHARALWNGAITRRPVAVLACTEPADVQAGVRAARGLGIPLAVRGGGHGWTGFALADNGLTLDLTGMRQVRVDPDSAIAWLEGGATSGDVAAAAERHGLVAVTGTVDAVGMAGLSLGGGYGPLSGRFGLAVDNIISIDVVLADSSLRTVDSAHDPDLFWALRGGGGNFGVITAMRVALHNVPLLLSGRIMFPWGQAASVLEQLGEAMLGGPDELTVQSGILTGPAGGPVVFAAPTWCGDPDEGARVLNHLARLGNPIAAQFAPATISGMLTQAGTMFPFGRHIEIRPRNVPSLTPRARTVLIDTGNSMTSPLSAVSLHSLHGAAARVPATHTAFGLRTPHILVETVAIWEPDDPDAADHRGWARNLSTSLAGDALPGGYPNLLAPDETEQIAHAYGAQPDRLMAVKHAVDPDSVFAATPLPK